MDSNFLQTRTRAAASRIARELLPRLKGLTDAQFQILLDGSRSEQLQILWLVVCKRYQIIEEFAVQIIREKYLRLDLDLTYPDYDAFFNDKAEWNEGLSQLTPQTRKKQRRVLFQILREAQIISTDHTILPASLSPRVLAAISADDPKFLAVFPLSTVDVQRQVRP
jgi:hypothetical protein